MFLHLEEFMFTIKFMDFFLSSSAFILNAVYLLLPVMQTLSFWGLDSGQ